MGLSLGIDTGGTYTDAVLFDDDHGILANAKSPTTRHDLKLGISAVVRQVVAQATRTPAEIGLVCPSTTLATNALVEGKGGHIALLLAGFPFSVLTRAGLGDSLRGDPHVHIGGGHQANGEPAAKLDLAALDTFLDSLDERVEAFAVASLFAVRNPEHELAIRERLRARTDLPVTCSHELSSQLDGPRRAMTTVLNARLTGLIYRLITDTQSMLSELRIAAGLMVVRGDGALMSAEVAKDRPIETLLSGPAASLVGAAHLTGLDDAMVSDIGGTTTDIGVLSECRPSSPGPNRRAGRPLQDHGRSGGHLHGGPGRGQ